ncbi:hypothetical protein, partial [Bifidobacterium thermophilum]|uniref:hypothetical protein n=1 Tax=Bifidobacterium thermophilum TaxID=33905 RepID=UPI00197B4DD8
PPNHHPTNPTKHKQTPACRKHHTPHTKQQQKSSHHPDTPISSSILFAFIALCQICSSHGSLILDKLFFIVGRISARDHME